MDEYALLDSGHEQKLERVGDTILVRPSPAAVWKPRLDPSEWAKAHGVYHRSDKGGGKWEWKAQVPAEWNIAHAGLRFRIKPTNFGHIGLFAEQAENWAWITEHAKDANVLNLFAYTGGSTLAAVRGGGKATHLDASRGIVTWAHENLAVNNMAEDRVRWMVDDVAKFVQREVRREAGYDGIILDPPSFGRGVNGEIWKIENDLPLLLEMCRAAMSANPRFFLLTSHSPGFTAATFENLLRDLFGSAGTIEKGEMHLVEEGPGGRLLPSGSFARWSR